MADAKIDPLPGLGRRRHRPAAEDDAVAGPDINKGVGRIYPALVKGEPKWLWFPRTEPAPPQCSQLDQNNNSP